jgi:hypothetical protein
MEILLAQGTTETVEIQQLPPTKTEDPVGGGVREEITLPQTSPNLHELDIIPIIPNLPMGTTIETITMPAPRIPLGTIPSIPEARVAPTSTPTSTSTEKPKAERISQHTELSYEEKYGAGSTEEVKQEPNGTVTIKREICDGEVHLGPFKSCLKEFSGVSAVGWLAAAAGLIVLWKWLDYRFKK